MSEQEFVQFVGNYRWKFASTYAAFCPHEYIVKDWLPDEEKKWFEDAVIFIRKCGFPAYYGKNCRMYFVVGDYYYWTMGDPVKDTIILNRAKLSSYIFTKDLFGDYHIRRRSADEDLPEYRCVHGILETD